MTPNLPSERDLVQQIRSILAELSFPLPLALSLHPASQSWIFLRHNAMSVCLLELLEFREHFIPKDISPSNIPILKGLIAQRTSPLFLPFLSRHFSTFLARTRLRLPFIFRFR